MMRRKRRGRSGGKVREGGIEGDKRDEADEADEADEEGKVEELGGWI